MPKVSVLIPTYNREKFLSEAIESVLNQTYQDYELLIVDDGSTDNTKKLVEGYQERFGGRLRYIYKEHTNLPHTRNTALKEAKGKYVAWLDSDDVFYPTKLEKQVKVLDGMGGRGLVHTYKRVFNVAFHENPFVYPRTPSRSSKEQLSGNGQISMTVLANKELFFEAGLFDEHFLYFFAVFKRNGHFISKSPIMTSAPFFFKASLNRF